MTEISIIIPTLNEEGHVGALVQFLKDQRNNAQIEVIVVDGGSTDGTVDEAKRQGAKIVQMQKSCRASQLNQGALIATSPLLFFVHADVKLRKQYVEDIKHLFDSGFDAGCYYYKFDTDRWLPQINAYFTRFDRLMFRGGDQTLIISREAFREIGGFDEKYVLMEDFDIVRNLRKNYRFKVIQKSILVSIRKYDNNSWIKVQIANLIAFTMFRLKRDPGKIRAFYYGFLN